MCVCVCVCVCACLHVCVHNIRVVQDICVFLLQCTVLEEHPGQTGVGVVMKNMRRTSIPGSPGKGNNEFPLR